MKLVSFLSPRGPRLGAIEGDEVVDLGATPEGVTDLSTALAQGRDLNALLSAVRASAPRHALATLRLAPAVVRPGKIVCLGLNYADHAREGGRARPEHPWIFLRSATSLAAPGAPVTRPRISEQLDFEAELAVVIGRRLHQASGPQALDAVFGYACFNDISVRDYQRRTPQWTLGKNFDGTGSLGPFVATADELPVGAQGLRIQCRLNGTTVQDANTRDMLFGVQETLVLLSECMTLEPGDVIAMGTPAGVGAARQPPLWMKHGDTVEVEIDGLGVLRNRIEDEAEARA